MYSVATPCSGSARPTWRLRPALGDGTHTARLECGCVLIVPLCPRRSSRRCTFWHRVALSPKQVFDSVVFSFFRCNSHGYTGCADFRFVSVMFALSCLYASTSSLFFRAVSAFFSSLQRLRFSSSSLAYLLPCTTCSTCSFAYSIARALWTNHSIFLSRFFCGHERVVQHAACKHWVS